MDLAESQLITKNATSRLFQNWAELLAIATDIICAPSSRKKMVRFKT